MSQKVKTVEQAQRTFMSAMSDSGLKPTVVYHNLSPAELYEKVRRPKPCPQALPLSTSQSCIKNRFRLPKAFYMLAVRPWLHWLRAAVAAILQRHPAPEVPCANWGLCCGLQALMYEPGSHLVSSGALATLSGALRTPLKL